MKKIFGIIAVVILAFGIAACDPEEESQGKKSSDSSAQGDVGNWKIVTKSPKFDKEFGTFATVDLKVKNVSESEDEPWLEIRLTNKKGDLVTTFDCIGDTVEPGQSTTLECVSLDKYKPFTEYEIKNAF